jgi:hypothetical protein
MIETILERETVHAITMKLSSMKKIVPYRHFQVIITELQNWGPDRQKSISHPLSMGWRSNSSATASV